MLFLKLNFRKREYKVKYKNRNVLVCILLYFKIPEFLICH